MGNLQQAILRAEEIGGHRNIKVQRNVKLFDRFGVEREFDLYWEYEFGGFVYKTVIECKDYASRISMEKIDALVGKIQDLPDVRAVFATRIGYQSGAEARAKAHKIELLIAREQSEVDWTLADGTPLVKEINIRTHALIPPRILEFNATFSRKWLEENTTYRDGDMPKFDGMNNETFIDDEAAGERYSIFELAEKLDAKDPGDPGEHTYSENFRSAFLEFNGTRVKLESYTLRYIRLPIITNAIKIDIAKEL
ncbi:restriction endonuclease [Herbaspirillum huttiense]|uniref:restriction endonuclease n=1 Tax=Herbaspirillum huttiense TaxID=863372 RepID=UPI003B3ADF19